MPTPDTSEHEAVIYLPESTRGLRVTGPATVVLDRVTTMVGCDFQGVTLLYRGEKVSLFEFVRKREAELSPRDIAEREHEKLLDERAEGRK